MAGALGSAMGGLVDGPPGGSEEIGSAGGLSSSSVYTGDGGCDIWDIWIPGHFGNWGIWGAKVITTVVPPEWCMQS